MMLQLPAGQHWAVGVSGGADSVALLCLLKDRPELSLHVVHLDHELRGAASTGDAEFVRELAGRLGLPCRIARRSEIEPELHRLPANPSARYRAIRLALFRHVVQEQGLCGVMLGHHADDVAETIFQRLVRGSGAAGLSPMLADRTVGGLRIVRPLLGIRREQLREYLRGRGQLWREDASNESAHYLRNCIRHILASRPGLTDALLELAADCRRLGDWVDANAANWPPVVPMAAIAGAPTILARESARRYLLAAGAPAEDLTTAVLDRFIAMATDAATPSRQQFPGNLTLRRVRGVISLNR
jgi:tRNA(Ile)-lysidine synthase